MKPQIRYSLIKPSIPYQAQRWLATPIFGGLSFFILGFCGYHLYDSQNFVTVEQAYLNPPRQTIKSDRSGKVSELLISPDMYVKQGQVIAYLTPEIFTQKKLNAVASQNDAQRIPIVSTISGKILPNSIPMEGLFLKSGMEIVAISSCKPMIDFLINQNEGKKITKGSRVSFQIGNDTYKGRIKLIEPYRFGNKINQLTYQEPFGHVGDLKQTRRIRGIVELDALSEVQFHENNGACNLDMPPFSIKILK
jgi:Biotin-lipoyl like